jgi:tetratricopeptide (TPR) repeat protein
LIALAACLLAERPTAAQQSTYELDAEAGVWIAGEAPEPGTDEWVIAEARRALAADKPGEAESALAEWLRVHERTDNPWLPEAYMLRGDARVARGNEYKALYDYETVAKDFTSSEVFLPTLERELRVARMYLAGLRKKFLGLRIESATPIGIELMMRIQERAPGSQLAETAAIELADHFYRVRDLELAAEMYSIFLTNYPQSEHRLHAMLRQIYANVGRFKGPKYDASTLVEARALIRQFEAEFPQQAEELGITEALIARLDESAAAQMLASAEWYLRRGDEVSARFILRRLVVRHDGTVAAAGARDLLDARGWEYAPPEPLPPDLGAVIAPDVPAGHRTGAEVEP